METGKKLKTLIVDDEDRFRETTARFLEKRGLELQTAESGEEALEAVKADDFDVVILDLKMGGMDGNQTLAELKRLKPELEVIMLTAHGSSESAGRGLESGVFDYLAKPCSLNVLERRILAAGAKKRGVAEQERTVREVMTPLSAFRRVSEGVKAGDLLDLLEPEEGGTVYEQLHRPFLIVDSHDQITGVLAIAELLAGLMPSSNGGDALGPENGLKTKGAFTIMARYLEKRPVAGLVGEMPPVIDAGQSLMDAASRMMFMGARRLLVIDAGKTTGLLREEDLILELFNCLKET